MDILQLRGVGLFVVAFLNLLLALLVWSRGKKRKPDFYLGLLALFSAFYAFSCGGAYFFWDLAPSWRLLWNRATWLGVFLLPCYITFIYYFIQETRNIEIKSFFLYLGAAVIASLALSTPHFVKSVYLKYPHIIGEAGALDALGRLYIFSCLIVGLFYLFKEYARSEGFRRLQIKYFIIGLTIYALGGIVATALVPLITGESGYYDIVAYLSLIWVAFTSYAIFKYRLMDIRLVLGKMAIYIFCSLIIVAVALLVVFLNRQLGLPFPPDLIWLLMFVITILGFPSLLRFFEEIAGKHFYYTFYSFQMTLRDLEGKLNRTIKLDELTNLINSSLLDGLGVAKVGIILKDPSTKTLRVQAWLEFNKEKLSSLIIKHGSFLSQHLEATKSSLGRAEIPFIIRETKSKKKKRQLELLREAMEGVGVEVLLPLLIEDKIIGFVVLGNKTSGEAYSAQELKLLSTFSPQASIALSNAIAYEEIKQRKEELERFYKLTVGRELKMVELKKKIGELEGKD